MARKQANMRRQPRRRRLPGIPLARVTACIAATAAVMLIYQVGMQVLDQPIRSIAVEGPFQRVSALQIEESISDELESGFLSADLDLIQQMILALPWIDQANVVRSWPDQLYISVTEQVAAARWGESGLLNTRGELFMTNARHIPAELPRLSGPEDRAATVASRYLLIREQLLPIGMDVRQMNVDPRGAWQMTLQNGIDVRLGRRDVNERIRIFLDIATSIVASRETEIEFVDMRYSNGFTIGWKDGSRSPLGEPQPAVPELVAERND